MEIRIDIESEGPDAVLYVAGRLTGPEVIRKLRARGADIRGASTFIKLLIDDEASQN